MVNAVVCQIGGPKQMEYQDEIEYAKDHFGTLIQEQLLRIQQMKNAADWIDYSTVKPIIIGIVGGDGIGPIICSHAERILKF